METSIDTFLFHSVFKVIFVCALSNRYFGGIVVGILAGYLGYQMVVKLKVIIDNRNVRKER